MTHYDITVTDVDSNVVYYQRTSTAGTFTVLNVTGFTHYNVHVVAENNANLESVAVDSIVTVETSMGLHIELLFIVH